MGLAFEGGDVYEPPYAYDSLCAAFWARFEVDVHACAQKELDNPCMA